MSKKYSLFIAALFCAFITILAAACFLTPERTFSEQENRTLQRFPKLTAERFFSGAFMSEFETYVTDQFAARDTWISAKTISEVALPKQENNDVYLCKNDTLIPRFSRPDPERVANNLNYVNQLADNLDVPVHLALIPGKVSVWSDRLPDNAPNASEEAILAGAKERTTANWVDMDSALRARADEDIYYRLDHHWTSLGAYYGYSALASALGVEPTPLTDYTKKTVSTDFNGTTYSSSGVRWMTPDQIDTYVPDEGITVESWFGPQPAPGKLYDYSKLELKDKYSFFMGGNQSLSVITTPHTDAPKILIIRDSYTDSLVPFLTPHFSEIHLFDPRYNKNAISKYVAENGIDQVVVMYSIANFTSDSNLFVLST